MSFWDDPYEGHRRLIAAAGSGDPGALPVKIEVRCGIKTGDRKCGRLMGSIRQSPAGEVWVPAVAAPSNVEPGDGVTGTWPILLPASTPHGHPDEWDGQLWITSPCAHGTWGLTVNEIRNGVGAGLSRKSKLVYFAQRAVPTDWGPRFDNPKYWTAEDIRSAHEAAAQMADGIWPPKGLSLVKRSQMEARVRSLLAIVEENWSPSTYTGDDPV